MPLTCGLLGLPNAGKSTLFKAVTAAHAEIAPYPFTTITPNVGVVQIPDPRLEAIARVIQPSRVVPATLEVVDIAGLVRNAHRGEGLGNQFLAKVREADALIHVVRCFSGPVPHVEGEVDPIRDIEIVETELLLADLATIRRAREHLSPRARAGNRAAREEDAVLVALEAHLGAGRPGRTFEFPQAPEFGASLVSRLHLLTDRPLLFVANVDEAQGEHSNWLQAIEDHARAMGTVALGINAKLELELTELPPDEAREFLSVLGMPERALPRLLRSCQAILGLRTFFTIVSSEVRAWLVPAGTRAHEAAGRIHTDMERGFIAAEVIPHVDLITSGSIAAARDRGLIRLEGKGYEVQDGDVITFRFAP